MLDLSRKAVTWMILSVVFFIVLTPGVLLTVPSMNGTLASMWTPKVPSTQVVVHAFVFAVVLNLAGGVLKKMGVLTEKFETPYQRRQREYAEKQRVVLENERRSHLERDRRGRR